MFSGAQISMAYGVLLIYDIQRNTHRSLISELLKTYKNKKKNFDFFQNLKFFFKGEHELRYQRPMGFS